MAYYEFRYKRTRPERDEDMKQRITPQHLSDCPKAPNEAYDWYASEVLRLDTANRELWRLYELRGNALVRVDNIIKTFAAAELAVKAIKELFRELKESERRA